MRALELFAGAGGMALGFHYAGWETAGLVEWDPHAQCTLRARFPNVPLYGDVSEFDGRAFVRDHGAVDLVAGGSPCQDLSVAGKRAGLEGARSGLFHEQMRVWEETGATYCLWENVAGALSSRQGADFAAVLSAFVGSPVAVPRNGWGGEGGSGGVVAGATGVAAWRILDSKYFGVPQRRRRIFVLGTRAGGVDPAAVLLESEGVPGHSPEGVDEAEGIAGTFALLLDRRRLPNSAGEATQPAAPIAGAGTSIGAPDDDGTPEPEAVGALDTQCGGNKATFQSVMAGHIIAPAATFSTPAIGDIREDTVASSVNANTGGGRETQNAAYVIQEESAPQVYEWHGADSRLKPTDTAASLNCNADGREGHLVIQPTPENKSVGFSTTGSVGYLHPEVMPTLPHLTGLNCPGAQMIGVVQGEGHDGVLEEGAMAFHPTQDPISGPVSPAPGVTSGGMGVVRSIGRPRRLLPIETERLMGWPDNWTNVPGPNGKPLSDSHRYRQCGNGVVSFVAEWIGRQLLWAEANAE